MKLDISQPEITPKGDHLSDSQALVVWFTEGSSKGHPSVQSQFYSLSFSNTIVHETPLLRMTIEILRIQLYLVSQPLKKYTKCHPWVKARGLNPWTRAEIRTCFPKKEVRIAEVDLKNSSQYTVDLIIHVFMCMYVCIKDRSQTLAFLPSRNTTKIKNDINVEVVIGT